MNHKFTGVIMAGGRGTRFWPLSTRVLPKQFLNLTGDRTMLQETAARFHGLCSPEDIMVVTGEAYDALVEEQLSEVPRKNVLLEPSGRNTAACIGWAARIMALRGQGERLMVVVPSDHVIKGGEEFRSTIRKGASFAEEGSLVTVGIPPDRPATGYGYLETGRELSKDVMEVVSFREKPDEGTAEGYLKSGMYLWNAGIFLWKADVILELIRIHLPELHSGLMELTDSVKPDTGLYDSLESISIDYGVMERAEDVVTVPAEFDWNDIGDWPSAGECGIGRGRVLSVDSSGHTVWNPGKLTVIMGLDNVSVVETDNATLVMRNDYAQELKKVVSRLEETDPDLV